MPIDPDLPDLPDGASLTEGVAADAVGAQLGEKRGPHTAGHTHCENCGTELKGPYCHRCGQHDFDINRSFTHTFLEALENFFHFDTKLFRNLIALLFQPGRMTAEFNAGKRASQVPPLPALRFYQHSLFLPRLPRQRIDFPGVQNRQVRRPPGRIHRGWKAGQLGPTF
uniref:DUF3667 domain-containing protein n=1 Tax=Cephaloticoccus sp. TaxID=1985742 RepID=UPI00404A33F3